SRRDFTCTDAGNTIHFRRVKAMKMDRVRMRAKIGEFDPYSVALGAADGRPWHAPVVAPGREENPRCNFDVMLARRELVLAQRLTIGQGAHLAVVPIDQHLHRVKSVAIMINLPDQHFRTVLVRMRGVGVVVWPLSLHGLVDETCAHNSGSRSQSQANELAPGQALVTHQSAPAFSEWSGSILGQSKYFVKNDLNLWNRSWPSPVHREEMCTDELTTRQGDTGPFVRIGHFRTPILQV